MDQTSTIPTLYTAPPTIQRGSRASTSVLPGPGAISGGLLRPGAIDQAQFKSMLQAAQTAQAAKQSAQQPLAIPSPQASQPSPLDGIPTLTPAQFAVLTGGQVEPGPSGALATPPISPTLASPMLIPPAEAGAELHADVPPTQISGKAAPQPELQSEPQPAAAATAAAESKPGSSEVAAQNDPQNDPHDDPRVVHFKHMPDQDERKALSASGKRWVVDETPGSRKLFFGDDEKFGWDDLADLVNPLQHIPIVAQIYRAATGDEINGAAELLGALPFGPSSFLTSVADLAVRESTGKDMGSNVIAMLFGHGNAPAGGTPATDTLAATPGGTGIPANAVQQAAIAQFPANDFGRDNGGHDS
jgi:hypothetical protein